MLLERDDSLSQLLSLSEKAIQGRGGIALIGGEAGIGKTSLLEAMSQNLRKPCHLLWGASDALFTPRPLGPLHDMSPDLSQTIRDHLADGVQSSNLYSSLLRDIEAREDGVVLVFEDAHWADHATLDLLKFLGRRISMLPALLVISFRNDEVDRDHPLTRVFGELPSAHTLRLDLKPLSPKAVETLGIPTGYSLNQLYDITGGNPFFVTELLEYRHNPESIIPASIKDAVGARLSRLSQVERLLLETISVIPWAVPMPILKYLFGENAETLAMACVGRNLLVQDNNGALKYRHELARLASLARISSAKQRELHGRVLEALLHVGETKEPNLMFTNQLSVNKTSNYEQLVHHAAGAFKADTVLEYAPKAAVAAASVGAHREAAAHLATALQFVNSAPSEVAAQLYEDWAYEAGLALRIDDEVLDARRHAITLWRALNRTEKVGENLRWLSRLHWYRGEASEADHFADEAVKALESTPLSAEHAMAYSLRSQLHMLNDRMDEAITWGERALELAKEYNHVEVKTHALNNIGTAKVFRNDESGVKELEHALNIALEAGLHEHAARVYTNLSEYTVEFNKFSMAEDVLAKGIAYNTQHDLFAWSHYLLGRQALLRMEQGRLKDAETIASGVLQADDLTLLMRLPALSVLATTRLRLGCETAYEKLSAALSDALSMDELQYLVPIHLGIIESAWLENDISRAREHLHQLNEIGPKNMHMWRQGETAVWAHRFNISISTDFLQNIPEPFQLEIDGDNIAAADHWEKLGLPHAAALALMHIKNTDQLKKELNRVQQLLEPMEANGTITKLRHLANSNGLSEQLPRTKRGPYKAAKNHPLGLTKREQQVLALVTKGSSNKDISDALSRSQRTVEHHVSSILTKLNASSRMEAMLRVHNEPWLLPEQS